MKIILTASAIAMVIAGIYGAADMGKEIKEGTMIDYEKNDRPLARIAMKYELGADINAPLKDKITVYLAEKKKKEEEEKKKIEELSNVKMEYFSRGEPIDYREVMEPLTVDSLVPQTQQQTTADNTQENGSPK
jgi:hypothetical protein